MESITTNTVTPQAPARSKWQTKPVLQLTTVKFLLEAAQAEAASQALAVSIAICDDGGNILGVHRMDEAAPATAAIAMEKARTAALIRRPGKAFEDIINSGRVAMLSIGSLSGMLEGGDPLLSENHCIGAIGVSGGRPNQDSMIVKSAQCALAAL